ncbi:sugar ABC transporter substrate-binding protein [Streptacidiphilus pinicola]|uniref:Sugar ABC transporter substrate-binding protein n=1 Tax=Streptacidiphilus pinicola TaxID=2219663 RepID=A0A2X0IQN9_9ACTN|nr:extracellular solute-binding protein [Streptacidiphilus pinicola]RAG85501.1 sugar ABC transporter substrate-binding protein [Streptacidiphilus pinicola]
MRRRLLDAAAPALAGLLVLTGCGLIGGQDGIPGATITLVAADYGSDGHNPSRAYWNSLIAAFEQVHPNINVKVQTFSWTDIDAKLAAMIQAGQCPDIVEGPGFGSWAQQKLLYPADQVTGGVTAAELLPGLTMAGEQGIVEYGIPFVASTRAFLINNALWRQAGLPTKDGKAVAPKSWADVEQAARRMKAAGVAVPLGLPLGPEEAQDEAFMWAINNGGGYANATGRWTIDSPANVATLTQLSTWTDQGLTEQNPASVDRTALYAQFAAGKVGMLNGMPIQLADITNHHLDVTWAPLPTAQAGQTPQTLGVADWISAFNPGGHDRQIGAFLDFVYQRQWQVKFDEEYGLLPVTQNAWDQVHDDEPALVPFLDALPNAQFVPADLPAWSAADRMLRSRMGQIIRDPQRGLDSVQNAVDQAGE